jgi:hypothetical protein
MSEVSERAGRGPAPTCRRSVGTHRGPAPTCRGSIRASRGWVPTFLSPIVLLVVVCCGDDTDAAALRVGGDHPYVRCGALDPEIPDGNNITLEDGARAVMRDTPERVVVFAGPGESALDLGPVRAMRPELVIVVGDLGRHAAELARLRVPVLFVAGGADRHPVPARGIIDASRLRSLTFGSHELVFLASAPDGRYAIDDDGCGFGADDLTRFERELGPPREGISRHLVSWAGPSGAGLAGVDGGSELVARYARRTGARTTTFAWPRESAPIVPIAGPWPYAADGVRRRPGPTLLDLDAP